jgi:hypothetical protein
MRVDAGIKVGPLLDGLAQQTVLIDPDDAQTVMGERHHEVPSRRVARHVERPVRQRHRLAGLRQRTGLLVDPQTVRHVFQDGIGAQSAVAPLFVGPT